MRCSRSPRVGGSLIVANSFLHEQVERLTDLVSPGFARGKLTFVDLPCSAQTPPRARLPEWVKRLLDPAFVLLLLEPDEFPRVVRLHNVGRPVTVFRYRRVL
jgi:hypothetical protein